MGIKLFSPTWWISMFINTFITLIFIYIIKQIFAKVNVPVVSEMVENV